MSGSDLSDIANSPFQPAVDRPQHSVFATRALRLQRERRLRPPCRKQPAGSLTTSAFGAEDLPAAILAGLEVDVMGAAALAGFLVLDIGGRAQARHANGACPASCAILFLPRNCHCLTPCFDRAYAGLNTRQAFTAASPVAGCLGSSFRSVNAPARQSGAGVTWGRLILHSGGSSRALEYGLSARHDAAKASGCVAGPRAG